MKNIRSLCFILLAGTMLLVSACSESFKTKLAAGMSIAPYFNSSSVMVGTATRTSADKGTRSLITVTIKDVKWQDYEEKQLEMLGCLAAHDFLKKLLPGDATNDQYIGIDLEDAMNGTKELEYKVADLLELDGPVQTATSFYSAFSKADGAGIAVLSDTSYLNPVAISEILELNRQVDSVFAGAPRKMEFAGLDPDEQMEQGEKAWQVLLTETAKTLKVRYLINIDKKSKKVIGVTYDSKKRE
jgi:hypothetical protein